MALLVFDLNGTLLDPAAADDRLAAALPAAIQLAMAHALAGGFRPLSELLRAVDPDVPLDAATRMPPFPDVPGALDRLAADGHRLAVLTNSAAATADEGLRHAGLRERFDAVVSAEDAGAHKPHPRAYAYGLEQMTAAAADAWLVAAHAWDIVGARGAGLRTAYIARQGPLPATVVADVEAPGLGGVADALAG